MFAFASSFITYLVIAIFLAAVMVLGVFIGKTIRDKKDAKKAAQDAEEKNTTGQA